MPPRRSCLGSSNTDLACCTLSFVADGTERYLGSSGPVARSSSLPQSAARGIEGRACTGVQCGQYLPSAGRWRPGSEWATRNRARNPRSPSPSPPPIRRGSGVGVPSPICRGSGVHPHRHPRFAGNRGSSPTAIPDLPESGIQLSTMEYCKGVEFRLPQCLTLRFIVQPIKLINLRMPGLRSLS